MAVAGATVAIGGVAAEAPAMFNVDQATAAQMAAPKIGHVLQTQGNMVQETPWAIENHAYEEPAVELTPQQCIKAAIARPVIKNTKIYHAGESEVQKSYGRVITVGLPDVCDDDVLRIMSYRFTVENPLHRARYTSQQYGYDTKNVGNEGGMDTVYITDDGSGQGLYKCSLGAKTTGAKLGIKLAAKDPATHHTVATKTYSAPIKRIVPHRC
jgi:hypothetical protein